MVYQQCFWFSTLLLYLECFVNEIEGNLNDFTNTKNLKSESYLLRFTYGFTQVYDIL